MGAVLWDLHVQINRKTSLSRKNTLRVIFLDSMNLQIPRLLLTEENRFTEEKRKTDKEFHTNDRYRAPPGLNGSGF